MVYHIRMKCGYCGEENRKDSLFCMACGSRIMQDGQSAAGQGETIGFVLPDAPAGKPGASFWDPEAEGASEQERAGTSSGFVFGEEGRIAAPDLKMESPAPAPASTAASDLLLAPGGEEAPRIDVMEPRDGAAEKGADYFMPPEADYPTQTLSRSIEEVEAPQSQPIPAVPPAQAAVDSTQTISPVPAEAGSRRKVICPECYAANTEHNRYCQECGNPLSLRSSRVSGPAAAAPSTAAPQRTTVMPAEMVQQAIAEPVYREGEARAAKTRSDRSFGVADVLALLGMVAAGIAISPIFTWKKGLSIGIFSHQGAYSMGRIDLLGGPGILPYSGAEFFTIGFITAVALGLAAIFLLLRTGRGPMLLLAGTLLLFPVVYMIFQGVLPLREAGVNIQPALGFHGILFGNAFNVGAGPSLWLITGGGLLILIAGFLAPPRGWGRLFTFMIFFSLVVGAAFFCAAAFNWNLFINNPTISAPALSPRALVSLKIGVVLIG
jgi:zinc-ribbon domain